MPPWRDAAMDCGNWSNFTMTKRSNLAAAALAMGCAFLFAAAPASALGLKDCSDKYSASKSKKTFAEFQKTECGSDAKPAAPAAAATTAPAKPAPSTAAPASPPAAKADAAKTDAAKTKADAKAAALKAKADAKAASKAARAEKRKADKSANAAVAKLPIKEAVYPTKIADEFKNKKPSKARFATCLAQYKANKATNANGGMKWIQKGGGYFSACNKKLKG